MADQYIYFGKRKQVRYNPESKRVCPSDCGYIFVTLILILVPTGLTYFLVVANEEIEAWAICLLIVIYTGVYICVCGRSSAQPLRSLGSYREFKANLVTMWWHLGPKCLTLWNIRLKMSSKKNSEAME